MGIDFAASLATSFAYGLVRLGCDAEAPMGTTGSLQNKISILTEKDLFVAISFGKCLRETVEAVERAKRHNVPTLGITDSVKTPIARLCDQCIVASTGLDGTGPRKIQPRKRPKLCGQTNDVIYTFSRRDIFKNRFDRNVGILGG